MTAPADLGTGALLLALVLATTTTLMLVRRRTDGRFRSAGDTRLSSTDLGHPLGRRATFVQFSSAVCATCPQVRRVLTELAGAEPDVVHVDLPSEAHDDLVRRLDVRRTPTVLLLDADGVVTSRTSGPVRPEQARAALATTRS